MNKIFKVIWSKSKQCYVVVSEIAKNTTGKKKIVVASIFAALAIQVVGNGSVKATIPEGWASSGGIAIGQSSVAKGSTSGGVAVEPSIAIGKNAYAEGNSTIAIGTRAVTYKKSYTVTIGYEANSSQDYGISVGYQSSVSGLHSMAIGESANASNEFAISLGAAAKASGSGANAIGYKAIASGTDSFAVGRNTNASDTGAIAIGKGVTASGSNSVSLGTSANATDSGSIAIGETSESTNTNSVALGYTSKANGASATAIGPQSQATKTSAVALGRGATATENYAVAIGDSASAAITNGVALGYKSKAITASGVAGYDANANRTNKYAGLTGNTLTSTLGAVSIGDGTNTRQITGLAAGTNDTDAVNVAQLKSVNLAFTGDNSSSGDVNLVNSKLAITGDNTYITTAAANQGLTIKAKKETITVSNGTASASIGVADARNVADAINQANADQKISYKANGNSVNSVKLSEGLNFTDGTSTVATVGNNGQVTYDLNAATKKSIADSEAAVKRTISLGADSGTRSSQSLNSNNVEFNVKGGSGSFVTTSMSGGTVTVNTTRGTIQSDTAGNASLPGNDGLATAQNVATAINKAKDGAAWNLAINTGAAQKVSGGNKVTFKDGKNINLTQSGTTITIGTTDHLTADNVTVGTGANQIVLNGTNGEVSGKSIKAGNTTMNTNGLTISGGPSVTTTGINAGNKPITNVASGLGNDSNAATVGDVKGLVNGLGNNSFKLTADSASTTAQALNKSGGLSFKVAGDGNLISTSATGDTVKVSISQGSLTNNTDGIVNASKAGVATTADVATAVNDAVAKATGAQGLTITDGTHNGKINLKTQSLAITGTNGVDATVNNQNLTVGLNAATKTAIDNAQIAVNRTISLGADSGTVSSQSLKDGNVAFNVKGKTGDYITTAMNGSTVEISTTRATIDSNATTGVASVTGADGLVTARNVSDAINKAAEAAKNGAAWNLTTNSSASNKTLVQGGDTVDLVNGDNIEISQDGTNKKKVTIKTKKDLTVDSVAANKSVTVGSGANQITLNGTTGAIQGNTFAGNSFTAGNSVLNTTGLHITGGPSVTATGIDAGNKAITNVASGLGNDSNAATVGDVKGLVDGVGNNTFTLTADSTSTTAQALNKSGGLSFKVAGDSNLISTSATGDTVTVAISQGSLTNNTDGTINANKAGVATTGDVANAVNDAVAKATGAQGLTITDGANTGKVNLKTQSLNITGTNGVDATVNNQTVTVGLNAATKTAIDNAQTAVNRTISLGADSGTASSQSLKDGNVAFNVKGKTGDYITTAMNGNTVEVSTQQATLSNNATTGDATVTGNDGLVTAKNVADTINAVADKIKTGAAWKLTTNSSTTDVTDVKSGDTVDLVNGDNIEISQDGTNKKKITIKTKKDLTVDTIAANKSVTVGSGANQIHLDGTTGAVQGNTFAGNSFTAGNSVLNTTGFHITGGPSVTATGIDAGNKAITNVASGGTTRSNAATVGDVQDAVANLSQNLNITDGTNNGTVDLKTQKLNVAGANGVTATVNNQTITVGLDTNVVNATTKGIGLTGDTGATGNKYLKDGDVSFAVTGDSNLVSTKATTAGVQVSVDASKIKDLAVGAVTVSKDATQTDNPITVTPTTGTNAKDYAIGIDTAKLATKTDLTYRANNDADANAKKVSLAKGLNFVNGTGTEATVGTNGTVSFGLDTATKMAIDNAQTAVNRTISLGADSGTASSQSLKDGNVAFDVKGKTGDYITTAMNGSTVEISTTRATITSNASTGAASVTGNDGLVTAKNVSDAINKAAEAAKNGAAWNLTTNSSATDTTLVQGGDTVDFVNGDNIEISQDGTNKKKVTIKTKKDLTVDTIAANKSVTVGSGANQIHLDGTTGAVQGNTFAGNSFTAGNSVLNTTGFHITGGPSVTAAGIDAGNKAITNVASGGTTRTNAATVGDVQDAVANLSQNLNITDGTNNGTVDLKTQKLNVAGANGVTATVNNQTITVGLDTATKTAIDTAQTAVNRTISLGADSGTASSQSLKDGNVAFNVKGKTGDYITTAMNGNTVEISTQQATLSNNATTGDATVTGNDGLVTAKNVADTINAVADKIKTSAAWKLTTNSSTTDVTDVKSGDTVDLVNGDNIEISQDGTNKKKVTIKTKKDLTVDSVAANKSVTVGSGANQIHLDGATGAVQGNTFAGNSFTAGNSVLNTTGFHITGGPSVTAAGIDAGNKAITNVASGLGNDSNAATVGDVKGLVDGVGNNTFTLTADSTSTTAQALNKSGGLSFKVAGDGNLVSTSATAAGVQVSVDASKIKDLAVGAVTVSKDATQTDNPITVTPTTGTNAKDYAIGIDTAKLATKTDLTYRANNDADANAKKVSLAKGLNFVNSTGTEATVGTDGTVSFGLDTATKTAIDNAQTAVNRTISLGADSGTASSQSLKDGNVAFDVKGKTGDYITTAMNGSTVEISTTRATINSNATTGAASVTGADGLVTAKNVSDAINKAAEAAKSGAAWNLTTNSSTTDTTLVQGGDTVDFVNGDNIEISQDGTNKKKVTIKTKKDLTVDSIAANKSVTVGSGVNQIHLDGTTGAVQGNTFAGNSFTAGNSVLNTTGFHITGGPSVTAAGIDAGNKAITNVASGGTTRTNAATVGDVQDAVANLSQNLNITDGTNNGTVDLKTQKLNVAGANGVTATVNNQTITVGLDTNVVNATTKGIGLTGDTGATGNKYLKDGDVSFAVTGDSNLVSTKATTAGVQVSVDASKIKDLAVGAVTVSKDATQTDNPITVTPTTGTNAKDYAIGIDTAKLATKTELTYRANNDTDANAKKVSLAKGLNFVNGTGTEATVGTNGTVSFGLDTATKMAIDNAQTAVNRTISLGADSGTASSQSLKDGNVAFDVKGKTGDYITTAMNGSTVEISTQRATITSNATTGEAAVTGDGLVTAKNVVDAINTAADRAKANAAWKLTTNSSTTDITDVKSGDTVDLVNGDNIEISQDGTNKKKVTIKTKKDLTVDTIAANKSVTVGSGANQIHLDGTTGAVSGNTFAGNSFTAGNSVLNTTGFHITGGPSVTAAGIDAGNKAITNVASGGTTRSNAATVGDVQDAVANLSQNLNITDGTNNGTVDLKTQKLNVAGANGVTATVNNQTITVGLDTNVVNATTKGIGLTGDTGATGNKYLKDGDVSFAVTGDSNLVSTKATTAGVQVSVDASKIKDLAVGAVTVSKDATQTDNPITVTPTTGTNAKDYAIGIDTAKLATKTELTYRANNDTDANAKKVSLAKGLNFVNGTGTEATVGTDGTVSFGLDTATKTEIDNAQTAVNRTISLGADSGTASSQSLKDGDVAFNVKGKTGDYITTAMNGSTVEISTTRATINSNATTGTASVTGADGLVTAKNVSDAINKAAEAAKSGAAWNLTTNSSTTDTTLVQGGDTVDFVNGDNIEISQDGTNKKKVTIKTKKDLTVDSIVANKSVTVGSGANQITLNGTTGAIQGNTFAGNSFTAGNSVLNTTGFHITGGPSVTAAGIDAGNKAITNVASGGTTRSNAATVGDVQDAVANLSQNLNITDGTNNGTVDLKTQKLNVAGANGVTATVNNQTITVGLDTNVVNATTKGIGLTGDTGATGNKYLKDGDVSFAIMGDGKLVTTTATATGVKVAVNTATITAGADGTITGPTTDGVATAKNVADAINAAKKAGKTEITANTGEAANVTKGNVTLTSTTAADGHTIYDVKLNDKVTLGSGGNAVTIDGTAGKATIGSSVIDGVNNTFTTGGNKAVTLNGATGTITGTTANIGGVTVNGTANTVNGLSNTTWNGTAVSGRAATEDQLQQVSDAVNAGWKVNTGAVAGSSGISTGATSTKVSSGEEVKLQAGDNLVIDQNGKIVSYSLNKDLTKMNSATFEATGGKTTVIKGDSIVQNDGAGNTNTSNATSNTLKNAAGDETKVDAKGATVKNAAGDTTKVNATGTTVADSTGNNKADYTKDGVTITKLGKDTVSLTYDGLNNGNNKIVNVATGTANTDAVNVGQLKDTVANSGWKVTVGTDGSGQSNVTGTSPEKIKADEIVTFKAGNNMIVTQTGKTISYALNPVLSRMTSATFTDSAGNTTVTNGNGITITPPAGGAPSVVSLTSDGLNNGGNKITNVAPGHAPTDAVNMSQLQGIGNSQAAAINQVAAEVERVGAHAAAMAALKPIQYDPLEPTQFMAGIGNYRGQTAAAIGLAHYTNDNTMFNVGVSVGGNHNMVNAGVTHKFGISAEKKNIPDRYKAGPISSIYVMQDEMTQLRSENEAYKAKLDKQQSEIDALKAAVDQLLASKS